MKQIMEKLDTSSWENYKRSLGQAMEFANEMGISDEQITTFAQQFGEYLAKNINPDLPENKSLKELWEVANAEEQKAIASAMIKVTKKQQ